MIERLPMEIKVRESGGVSILEVHGRLTIGEPSEQLYSALESVMKKGTRKVIVALNSTPQIDSSGLSTLVWTRPRPRRSHGDAACRSHSHLRLGIRRPRQFRLRRGSLPDKREGR